MPKQQASLTPILVGWKRWMELNTANTEEKQRESWLVNLRTTGSISTNSVEKAVSWNVGPHGYQRGKSEIYKIFEQGPPIIYIQDARIPKKRKNSVKRGRGIVYTRIFARAICVQRYYAAHVHQGSRNIAIFKYNVFAFNKRFVCRNSNTDPVLVTSPLSRIRSPELTSILR